MCASECAANCYTCDVNGAGKCDRTHCYSGLKYDVTTRTCVCKIFFQFLPSAACLPSVYLNAGVLHSQCDSVKLVLGQWPIKGQVGVVLSFTCNVKKYDIFLCDFVYILQLVQFIDLTIISA